MQTVSGRIKVAIAPRRKGIPTEFNIFSSRPLNKQRLPYLQYRCFKEGEAGGEWNALPLKNESPLFPYAGLLLDTLVAARSKMVLQFRNKEDGQILQQHLFSRPEIIPTIEGFRERNAYDSIDNSIISMAFNSRMLVKGFDSLKTGPIIIQPGKHLELIFKILNMNRDSCLQFRVVKEGNKEDGPWNNTGHLLTLHDLVSQGQYQLEVKYMDMDSYQTYVLVRLPYWYETKIALIVFALFMMGFLIGFPPFLRNTLRKRKKHKRVAAEKEMRIAQNQLTPHFIYNALNSILGLVTNGETEKANEYLSTFSKLMRQTFENSESALVPIITDIDMLELYIRIEQLRFEFSYCFHIDPLLELDSIEVPSLLLQPAIENAVKHGIAGMGPAGHIDIYFNKKGDGLEVVIQDNGQKEVHQPGTGYGIKLTKKRLEHLQHIYQVKMDYQLVHETVGCKSIFLLENWITNQ